MPANLEENLQTEIGKVLRLEDNDSGISVNNNIVVIPTDIIRFSE